MKKVVSVLLACVLLCAFPISSFAATDISSSEIQIQPYYLAITYITATISMSGGQATCSVDTETSGAKVNIQLILQMSTNGGSTFSDHSTLLNQLYAGSGAIVSKSKSSLSTSYKYRTKVVVTVYDANGKQIDQGTAYSPAK